MDQKKKIDVPAKAQVSAKELSTRIAKYARRNGVSTKIANTMLLVTALNREDALVRYNSSTKGKKAAKKSKATKKTAKRAGGKTKTKRASAPKSVRRPKATKAGPQLAATG